MPISLTQTGSQEVAKASQSARILRRGADVLGIRADGSLRIPINQQLIANRTPGIG